MGPTPTPALPGTPLYSRVGTGSRGYHMMVLHVHVHKDMTDSLNLKQVGNDRKGGTGKF